RLPPPPYSPLSPYTTLFRSGSRLGLDDGRVHHGRPPCPPRLPSGPADDHEYICHRGSEGLRWGLLGQGVGERPERVPDPARPVRSEEHTSELQSRENLVCRL